MEVYLLMHFVFGIVGLAVFVYGKRQRKPVPLAVGIALMVVPYFITQPLFLTVVGAGLLGIVFYVRT